MKFTAVFAIAALQASFVFGGVLKRVTPTGPECQAAAHSQGINPFSGNYSQPCSNLVFACLAEAKTTTYVWHKSACVAAATCQGVLRTVTQMQCVNNAIPAQASISDFSTNIYAGIVHNVSGASVTQQNFIDFAFGELTVINTNSWPSASEVIQYWWTPLNQWVNRGSTVPYANWNDWFHYVKY